MKSFLALTRLQKQMVAIAMDIVMLPFVFCLTILLRYDGMYTELLRHYVPLIVAAPLVSVPIFIRIGLYRAVIRFIDQKIVYVVVLGVSIAVSTLGALSVFLHMTGLSRGVLLMYWIGAILYVITSRFLARGYLLHATVRAEAIRVAIYGAGTTGTQLAAVLRAGQQYLPVVFVDDAKELQGTTISGIGVWGLADLGQLIVKKGIKEVMLAMPSLSKMEQRHILNQLEPFKIRTKVMPSVASLLNGTVRMEDVREIEIEDLLGRETVTPDPALMTRCITGKTVLVTGAGGSIGSELCRQIVRLSPARLLLMELSEFALYSIEQELQSLCNELDASFEILPILGTVLDPERCERVMRVFDVDTVYHAAAYKHVPLVEHNPIEGIRNNVFGTAAIARAAMTAGVRNFVLISTDKAVRPTNVMGATKRLAELVLQAFAARQSATCFCMVRFGNVLGSSGSVVPLFRKQIRDGGPITLTHPEITRYFMTISEAAQLVLQAGAMGKGGDVFVLDMGEPVKIMDLARRMVHLSGLEVKSESSPEGTIEIHHIGLRPGEKLYEELLIGANAEGTGHRLIMRAQEAQTSWSVLEDQLNRLQKACEQFDYVAIRAILQQSVIEYQPQCDVEDFIWRQHHSGGASEEKQEQGASLRLFSKGGMT